MSKRRNTIFVRYNKLRRSSHEGASREPALPGLRVVWRVLDDQFREVACFPYDQKEEAYKFAAKQTLSFLREYIVQKAKKPKNGQLGEWRKRRYE